MFIKMSAGMK